jgi:alkylhydroperoxidase family enzyme
MARFKYLNPEDVAPEHRPHMRDINLTRILFHNPEMARASNEHAMYIRNKSKLDPRLREIAIIQVGYSARSPYEYSHHVTPGSARPTSAPSPTTPRASRRTSTRPPKPY